mgnify:CR=1 FL=1
MSYFSLGLDIVVAGLLIATIVYASVLNKKLATLRSTKQEMENLAARLVESTQHAERALSELKSAAGENSGKLESRVNEARTLVDDLRYLVDKGTGLADRLTNEIAKGRESGGGEGSAAKKSSRAASRRRPATADMETEGGRAGGAAKASPTSWEDEDVPDADAQLLKALRRVR